MGHQIEQAHIVVGFLRGGGHVIQTQRRWQNIDFLRIGGNEQNAHIFFHFKRNDVRRLYYLFQ